MQLKKGSSLDNAASTEARRGKRPLVLALVVLIVLVGSAAAISWTQKSLGGKTRLEAHYAKLAVSEDGWASSQTGVYALKSDPSRCFVIKASPHGGQRAWVLEPSDALASTMISAMGWVAALNPTRGKVMVWNGAFARKEVKFVYMGTTITIDGVTYERRPKVAPWECKPQLTTKTAVYAKSFGAANCQWLMQNPQTKGFVVYYTKGPGNIVGAGAGYFDDTQNKGQVAGYHHSGALDGVYDTTKQANPPAYLLYLNGARFAGGAWDFIILSSCSDPGYPTVTQQVGPLPTFPTQGQKGIDKQYRVTPQASWSQAAVACLEDGMTLCTKQQYCPSGTGSKPDLGGLVGDVWAPIGDMLQNFVQLADPNRYCADHLTKYRVLPKWEYYGTSINTAFRCCPMPSQLTQLSLPMQELILNDAQYRFILDGTFAQASQACAADGMKLCTALEYCPNGGGELPLLGVVPGGDVWAPVTDSRYSNGNNWVQVSDMGRICHTHGDLYNVLPTWTSCCTAGKKTPFRCCH